LIFKFSFDMRSGPIIFSTKIELKFPCTLRQQKLLLAILTIDIAW